MNLICPHCYIGDIQEDGTCDQCQHVLEPDDLVIKKEDDRLGLILLCSVIAVGVLIIALMRGCS